MKGYRTKRISLPGGRVIEIVYFFEPEDGAPRGDARTAHAETTAAAAETAATRAIPVEPAPAHAPDHDHDHGLDELDLHECPSCGGALVYPVAWEERQGDRWSIERRCPNCEWRDLGEFDQDEVENFDDVLNEGTEDLLVALRNFARANMEADIHRLIDAINNDQIEPMDF